MSVSYPTLTLTMAASGALVANRFIGTDFAQAGAGANTLGVVQMPGTDEDIPVDVLGAVPVEVGAAVTAGALIESDASGRAITRTSGAVAGRVLESATAAGQRVLCVLIPN